MSVYPSLPADTISLAGHEFCVSRIAFLPGESRIVTASLDKKARVYSADSGQLLRTFSGHAAMITALAVLCDDVIATGDEAGLLCIWCVSLGCTIYRARSQFGIVWALAPLDGGRFVGCMGDGSLLFFAHNRGQDVVVKHAAPQAFEKAMHGCCMATHGHRLVTAAGRKAKVWDLDTREVYGVLDAHAEAVLGVSMDGNHIVTTTGLTGPDLQNSDEATIAEMANGGLYVWDARTLALLRKVSNAHDAFICSPTILGDRHVLTASADESIAITDMATGALVQKIDLGFEVRRAVVTPDGRIAACGGPTPAPGEEEFPPTAAVTFTAPQPVAAIIRARAAEVAYRLLGVPDGARGGKGRRAAAGHVRGWRAVGSLPS